MNKLREGLVIAAMAVLVFSVNAPATQVAAATKSCTTSVQSTTAKKGTTFNCGSLTYKVTGNNTVACTGFKNSKSKAKSCTIPSTVSCNGKTYKVTSVANNAFSNCNSLKSVTISNSCKSIGKNAFSGCSNLSKVNLGNCVKTVSKNAFANCGKLNKK